MMLVHSRHVENLKLLIQLKLMYVKYALYNFLKIKDIIIPKAIRGDLIVYNDNCTNVLWIWGTTLISIDLSSIFLS